jgi:acyl-homoserine lactone acylase PvdQ
MFGDNRCSIDLRCLLTTLIAALIAGLTSNALAGEATLYRDQWGVPHIWADDYPSAGYAVGRAQCEDSLSNVIYCLHAGVGRLAEMMGPSMQNSDIEARKLRHRVSPSVSVARSPRLTPYRGAKCRYLPRALLGYSL